MMLEQIDVPGSGEDTLLTPAWPSLSYFVFPLPMFSLNSLKQLHHCALNLKSKPRDEWKQAFSLEKKLMQMLKLAKSQAPESKTFKSGGVSYRKGYQALLWHRISVPNSYLKIETEMNLY